MTTRQADHGGPSAPMVRLLQSPVRHVLPRSMVLLRYVSASGATITLPVQAAQDGARFVVLVGDAERKRWWRHFRHAAAVDVYLDGAWHRTVGQVATATGEAASVYRHRFPRTRPPDPAVFVDLRCVSGQPPSLLAGRCSAGGCRL